MPENVWKLYLGEPRWGTPSQYYLLSPRGHICFAEGGKVAMATIFAHAQVYFCNSIFWAPSDAVIILLTFQRLLEILTRCHPINAGQTEAFWHKHPCIINITVI